MPCNDFGLGTEIKFAERLTLISETLDQNPGVRDQFSPQQTSTKKTDMPCPM